MSEWAELAAGVLVRRYAELDLSVGLVLGAEQALVVDTRGDRAQGVELARAVREVTSLPWQVAITHGHFDHCFGTGAFLPAPVWAQRGCVPYLRRNAARQRAEWSEYYRGQGRADIASALAATEPAPPEHLVTSEAVVELGGRSARLLHLGHGHTNHDLVVEVPDAGVVFAGDLVESGAPPDFEDAHPAEWPSTLDALLRLRPSVVVTGHGNPVRAEYAAAQRDEIAALVELCGRVRSGEIGESRAVRSSPYPPPTTLAALRRFAG